jgi:hypothetical protein
MSRIIKENIYFTLSILFYKYLVDLTYIVVQERFEYAGLFKIMQSYDSSLLSWGLLLLSIPLIRKAFQEDSLSAKVIAVLYLISVVPTISIIGFRSDYSVEYILLISLYWLVFIGLWNFLPKIIIFSSNVKSLKFLYLVLFILTITVLYISGKYTNFHLQTDLFNVYEQRASAREFDISGLLTYIWLLSDNILPFSVVYLIHKKKYMLAILIAIVVYINFSITATKQIIALLALGVFGYFFYRYISKVKYLLILFSFVLVLSLVETMLSNTYLINTLFPYRILFIPAELHHSFFMFFSVNPHDYFAQSFLRSFIESDYDRPIAFLLGEFSINDITARANNGLFSDAYQNLGLIGVFVMPIFTVIYLKALDGASLYHDNRLFFVLTLYAGFVLLGIPLSTALISSGLLGLLFLLYLLPKDNTR